jgi:hypothetical protein
VRCDIFKTDFSDATVVTTFLLPSMNLRLQPTFLAMKPGTRIVANTFAIAGWEPDASVAIEQWLCCADMVVPASRRFNSLSGDQTLQRVEPILECLGKEPSRTDGFAATR